MPDPITRQKLQVELVGGAGGSGDLNDPALFRPGDRITLRITNMQAPGAANDPALVLNISVLSLDSDWSITQLYPRRSAFEPVDPGQTIEPAFEAYLDEGNDEDSSTFLIFATQTTTDFRWLQLPALGEPPIERGALRSGITDPLEKVLAMFTDQENKAPMRKARPISSPEEGRGWTVERRTFRVRR
jgi:hypothetical protein